MRLFCVFKRRKSIQEYSKIVYSFILLCVFAIFINVVVMHITKKCNFLGINIFVFGKCLLQH